MSRSLRGAQSQYVTNIAKLFIPLLVILFFDALQQCCRRLWHGCRLFVVCLSVRNGCIVAKPWVTGENLLHE